MTLVFKTKIFKQKLIFSMETLIMTQVFYFFQSKLLGKNI